MVALTIPVQGWLNKKDESYIKDDRAIISYHIISYVKFIVSPLHYVRPWVHYIVRRYKVEPIKMDVHRFSYNNVKSVTE